MRIFMEYLRVGNKVIEYELRKSSKAKRINVAIKDQRMSVAVPTGYTMEYAKNFLESHKELLLKHFLKHLSKTNSKSPKEYVSGEKFLYRGRNYPLLVEMSSGSEYFALFKGSRIVASIPSTLLPDEQRPFIQKLIKEWYIGQAAKLLPEQVEYYSKLLNIPYKKLKIKDQKTRWGSCSNKGNINLNWRIIMAPNQVVAYVIIHELSHLRFMNHSKDFWKLVEQHLPDYKKWRKWLTENGKELFI
ncbi:MAG: M48 family metallopeptidase [Peptococcaceae bacterium]|nr:M48 family metallopeptidase [Peptococcaceae bacterium]